MDMKSTTNAKTVFSLEAAFGILVYIVKVINFCGSILNMDTGLSCFSSKSYFVWVWFTGDDHKQEGNSCILFFKVPMSGDGGL